MSVAIPLSGVVVHAQRDVQERNVLRLRAQAEGADTVRELEAIQNAADRAVRIAEQRDVQVAQVRSVLLIRSFIRWLATVALCE